MACHKAYNIRTMCFSATQLDETLKFECNPFFELNVARTVQQLSDTSRTF